MDWDVFLIEGILCDSRLTYFKKDKECNKTCIILQSLILTEWQITEFDVAVNYK